MISNRDLEKLLEALEVVVRTLRRTLKVLRRIQASVPAPSPEEVRDIQEGKGPLTRETVLYVLLNGTSESIEYFVSALEGVDLEFLEKLHELSLGGVDFEAMNQAIAAWRRSRV